MEHYDFDPSNMKEAVAALRSWREGDERRSDDVIDVWQTSVGQNPNGAGKDKHVLLEQVIFAALDCHYLDIADACISMLSAEFPGSLRVHRYRAMVMEAYERYDEALDLLESLIKRDETNPAPRKRRVAVFKARGRNAEAIKELTEYLKKFMSDVEAWQELSELYLSENEYSKAVFCAEELLLHQPHSHLFYQRVADIRYTMGGVENLELAKTYYCQAIHLNNNNMRANIGLFLTCNSLMALYKSGSGNKKKVSQLAALASKRIKASYQSLGKNLHTLQGPNDDQEDAVDGIVDSLSALTVT